MKRLFLSTLAFWTLLSPPAVARVVEHWSYDRLFKESDLVVIAIAKSTKTGDPKETIIDGRWPLELVAQNTTFEILHVLKGNEGNRSIELLHYRFGRIYKNMGRNDPVEIVDGPSFVSFLTTLPKVEIGGMELYKYQFEYMLFLRKRADGRYEPVSGQIDPDLSIRELFLPYFSKDRRLDKP